MVARMTRILKRTVWALAQQLKEGAFEPTGYEIKFDFSDGLDSARMDLGDEHTMRLSGQIDRLDALQDGDKVLLKVIDYKSGKMTFSLSNLYYGLQMQLVVYMNAATEFTKDKYPEKEIETAGIFYYNMDDPIVTKDEEEAVNQALLKALKMNGLVNRDSHVIPLLDQAFAAGDTFFGVNMFFTEFVFGNRADRTSFFTGNRNADNRMIGADFMTFAAVNAFFGINPGAAVDNRNRFFGAVEPAGLSKTAAAGVGDHIL